MPLPEDHFSDEQLQHVSPTKAGNATVRALAGALVRPPYKLPSDTGSAIKAVFGTANALHGQGLYVQHLTDPEEARMVATEMAGHPAGMDGALGEWGIRALTHRAALKRGFARVSGTDAGTSGKGSSDVNNSDETGKKSRKVRCNDYCMRQIEQYFPEASEGPVLYHDIPVRRVRAHGRAIVTMGRTCEACKLRC